MTGTRESIGAGWPAGDQPTQGPAKVEEDWSRWRSRAISGADTDDGDHDADEVDPDADVQDRLAGTRRDHVAEKADHDDGKPCADHSRPQTTRLHRV